MSDDTIEAVHANSILLLHKHRESVGNVSLKPFFAKHSFCEAVFL